MNPISVLFVVQHSNLYQHLSDVLEHCSRLRFEWCASAQQAMRFLRTHPCQILYTDLSLENGSGVELTQQVKRAYPDMHVLVGSSGSSAQEVLAVFQAGADDFIMDPWAAELVEHAFEKAVREVLNNKTGCRPIRTRSSEFITRDKTLLDMLGIAKKVASSTATILITGESGTGKELLASYIHAHSSRGNQPYVAINCAALPEQLAESELFGHEKGAFTGALNRKVGKFESAEQGTLVLDEITEMALPLQAKLLRALQEREIVRVGGNRAIEVQARVIAVSNQNMKAVVQSGAFRADLFYRLNVIPLTIPPLRERKTDIPLLAEYFFNRFRRQHASPMLRIGEETMAMLTMQSWPGNVRELENAIQRGVLIGSGEQLLPGHLILEESLSEPVLRSVPQAGMTVKEVEKELIFNTLDAVNDNRTHAAKMLGISIRTLRNKLNEYRGEMMA